MSDGQYFNSLPFQLHDVVLITEDCPVCPEMLGIVTDFIGDSIVQDRNLRGNIGVRFVLPNHQIIYENFVAAEFAVYYKRVIP